jgi:hypothetical protein
MKQLDSKRFYRELKGEEPIKIFHSITIDNRLFSNSGRNQKNSRPIDNEKANFTFLNWHLQIYHS